MKKRGLNCGSFVFIFLLGIGIFWVVSTIQDMQDASDSEDWLVTTGTIEDSWVERDLRTDAEGDSETYYEPHLRYQYLVNGTAYSSQRVDFGQQRSYGWVSRANNFLDQYPVGSQVDVFYDPGSPSQAVLVREAHGATGGLIGGGAMILLSVVGWIGLLIKGKRAQAATNLEDLVTY